MQSPGIPGIQSSRLLLALLAIAHSVLAANPLPNAVSAGPGPGRAEDAVRNSAGVEAYGATLTPELPAGAVLVPAASGALAKAVNAHGPNTVFFLQSGLHTGNGELRPQAGSVFVGEKGAILDGENQVRHCFVHDSSVIPYAQSAPRYVVTLRNLIIRNFVPGDQECAVMAESTGQGWNNVLSDPADRNGWLFEACTFSSNQNGGLFLGSASTARHCLACNNGQIGFKATGRGVQLLACRSTGNNRSRTFDYFREAGGLKCWNVKDLLIDGGEYDGNGGPGVWTDYAWDGNVIRKARFRSNYRAGIAVEMTVGVEIAGCTFSGNDLDGIAGAIPAAFRPWDKAPRSGPDLWTGEMFLFNGCGAGTFVHPVTRKAYPFTGKTWIHGNQIREGHGGIQTLYQDRGSIDALGAQMQGSTNGPVAGLAGIVIEDNDITCATGYAGAIQILPNRDYKDGKGSWGPIPATLAQAQYRALRFGENRYAGELKFCVPKAAALRGSTNIWDWNERIEVGLTDWQSFRQIAAPGASSAATASGSASTNRFDEKSIEQWTHEGPLGPVPGRVAEDLPLSDQENRGRWVKFEPMWDEFSGPALDLKKWTLGMSWWQGRQPAWFNPSNVVVGDGQLHLTMRQEAVPKELEKRGYRDYTSAALHTQARSSYGFYEVRARPMNSGGSSAFWFQQEDRQQHPGWATEIDVFELCGKSATHDQRYYMTVHVFATPQEKRHWQVGSFWRAPKRFAEEYHVYGFDWGPDQLRWYVDGQLVRTVQNTHWHQPLYLIFDSETMPEWFGMPNDADLPSTFSIDYVRAWKRRD